MAAETLAFFLVYTDLALAIAPAFQGFPLIVFLVNCSAFLGFFVAGKLLSRWSSRFFSSRAAVVIGYLLASVAVLGVFWMYPLVRGFVTASRHTGPSVDTTIVVMQMNWYDEHTTHGVVVTTQETVGPIWLDVTSLSTKQMLLIRIGESQMDELRRLLRKEGFFSLPHRVDVEPSMDHSLFGVSLLQPSGNRHVLAKLSSHGWNRFERSMTTVLEFVELPINWEWRELVPDAWDYRARELGGRSAHG